jgi:hypothetical protein
MLPGNGFQHRTFLSFQVHGSCPDSWLLSHICHSHIPWPPLPADWLSVLALLAQHWHRLYRKHLIPQFLYCCVASVITVTRCHETFTGLFPSNGHICCFHNSDFEHSWHNTLDCPSFPSITTANHKYNKVK